MHTHFPALNLVDEGKHKPGHSLTMLLNKFFTNKQLQCLVKPAHTFTVSTSIITEQARVSSHLVQGNYSNISIVTC